MKKVVCMIVALLSATIFVFALTACGEHTCTYSDKWSYDGEKHWHDCANEKCENVSEEDFHDLTETTDENGAVTFSCFVCGYSVTDDKSHEHTYGDVYEKNDKCHYLACKTEGCQIKKDYKKHTFGNPEETFSDKSITRKYVCTICDYEKTVTIEAESVIESAEKWNLLFKNVDNNNYSLVTEISTSSYTSRNEAYITETGAYVKMGYNRSSDEMFMIKNEDGSFANYWREDDEKWGIEEDTTSNSYDRMCVVTKLSYSFENNFDKFTYDDREGVYTCTEEVSAEHYTLTGSGELDPQGTIICSNVKIKVADDKLVYIEADYVLGESDGKGDDFKGYFKYYNIGSTEVSLTAQVLKDIASKTEDDGVIKTAEEWNEVFQNASTTNFSYKTTGSETVKSEAAISESGFYCSVCQGNETKVKMYSMKNDEGIYDSYKFSDGKWIATNGSDIDCMKDFASQYYIVYDLTGCFDKFYYDEETDTYNYSGNGIEGEAPYAVIDSDSYKIKMRKCYLNNIEVKIEDGELVSVEADITIAELAEEENLEATARMLFYDIGSTVVTLPQDVLERETAA